MKVNPSVSLKCSYPGFGGQYAHSSRAFPSICLASARDPMKLCKAQAIPISMYHDRPVEMLKIAQKPTMRIPKVSTATIRSAAVGPLLIL